MLYNVILGAHKVTDAPITIKRVLENFAFCSTRFLQSDSSIAGFLLQSLLRINRYDEQITNKDKKYDDRVGE